MKILDKIALESVRTVVAEKPVSTIGKGSLACVKAGDLVRVCDLVPEEERDDIVKGLRLGGANAMIGYDEVTGGLMNVFVNSDQLRHVLEKIPAEA